MLNLLDDHYKWIFSGVGNSFIGTIYKLFKIKGKKSNRKSAKKETKNVESIIRIKQPEKITSQILETQQVSHRFKITLELINEERRYDNYTIAKLAQIMNLKKISDLENVFTGALEPTFNFMKKYAETFGINFKWLSEGHGTPFDYSEERIIDPTGYIRIINERDFYCMYLLRSDCEKGRTLAVFRLNDWKYETIKHYWHVSSHLGGTGSMQLLNLYNFIETYKYRISIKGKSVSDVDFGYLYSGEKYPGYILDKYSGDSNWWHDLTDLNNEGASKNDYEKKYGNEFVIARNIIRNMLAAGYSGAIIK